MSEKDEYFWHLHQSASCEHCLTAASPCVFDAGVELLSPAWGDGDPKSALDAELRLTSPLWTVIHCTSTTPLLTPTPPTTQTPPLISTVVLQTASSISGFAAVGPPTSQRLSSLAYLHAWVQLRAPAAEMKRVNMPQPPRHPNRLPVLHLTQVDRTAKKKKKNTQQVWVNCLWKEVLILTLDWSRSAKR